jgi:PAS domain S-box-containing protein
MADDPRKEHAMPNETQVEATDRLADVENAQHTPMNTLRDANEQLTLATLRAHEEADRSALRYRDLVEGLDAIVWEADAETWQFTFVSQWAKTLLGYPLERWLQEPTFWIDLIHPEDREQTVRTCKTAVSAQHDVRVEYRVLASDGRVVWLLLVAHLRQRDEDPAQAYGLMFDITESQRTKATLQQLVRELETSRADLQERNEELEKFHDITVGRELKMIEVEKEVERLQRELEKLTSEKPRR